MPRKQYQYHYIYKTTNFLTDKFYIGMHSTNDLNDGYIGSGKRLWYSINKYGKENHKCEILEFLPNRDSLINREREIVNEEILQDPMCMNLIVGGQGNIGGFDYINNNNLNHRKCFLTQEARKHGRDKKKWLFENDLEYKTNYSKKRSKIAKANKNFYGHMLDKKHKEESKKKIGIASSKHQTGKGNSQYGTMWITNGIDNKKIKKVDIIPDGWYKGRKIKK